MHLCIWTDWLRKDLHDGNATYRKERTYVVLNYNQHLSFHVLVANHMLCQLYFSVACYGRLKLRNFHIICFGSIEIVP